MSRGLHNTPRPVIVHEPPPDPAKLHLRAVESKVADAGVALRRARDAATPPDVRRSILKLEADVLALSRRLLERAG